LYCAVDEAQEGLKFHEDMFRSTSGAHRRPALYALYKFYNQIRFFDGYIFAGTGLSMSKLELDTSSIIAKHVEGLLPVVFTDTVHFTTEMSAAAHQNYISRYLKVISGDQISSWLMERILYWFHGRYMSTVTALSYVTNVKLQSALDGERSRGPFTPFKQRFKSSCSHSLRQMLNRSQYR